MTETAQKLRNLSQQEIQAAKSRFEEKYREVSDGCWLWEAGIKHRGYGGFNIRTDLSIGAHRASYILYRGEIPDEQYVLHTCDVKRCVNPDHLYLGTQQENLDDAVDRGQIHFGLDNPSAKISDDQVVEIRRRYLNGNKTQKELAKDYPIGPSMISRIVNRNRRQV